MFFIVSKIGWFVFAPSNLIALLLAVGVVLLVLRRRRAGATLLGVALAVYLVCGFTTLGRVLLQPLEDRFARPSPAPATVTGIVLLGGGMGSEIGPARLGYELNDAGDRFVEALRLLRVYPGARLVFTGGFGRLSHGEVSEAEEARRFFAAFGVADDRLSFDDKARDTAENATYSRPLAAPAPGETWLLVTSAYHMPRAVGAFRAEGFAVTAWPVDYHTSGREILRPSLDGATVNFFLTETALHEWLGLLGYWMTGRTDTLFPAPATGQSAPAG